MKVTEKDVMNKADELAQLLTDSDIYQDYLTAYEKLKNKSINKSIVDDIKAQHVRLYASMLTGQEEDEEGQKKLEELYFLAEQEPVVNEFLTAEYRLMNMVEGIYKTWFKDIENIYEKDKDTMEEPGIIN